jgi:NADPH-dependent 2,4-dienoyl-CoA reductase/sulfur reductase-like enzyme
VGGGLIGIEMAEMFHSRHIPVTFLVREESYWNNVLPPEESEMINRHIIKNGIDLRLGVNLETIHDNGKGEAEAVTVKETGERITCGYVGLTVGVSPNIDWLKDTRLQTERGIIVDEYLRTNVDHVYAVGDCAQLNNPKPGRRPIEAIWYTGRMMGETVAYGICGKPTVYDPGIWFNSAKFMDIEYQVYGDIPPVRPAHIESLYWEHTDGEKSIRINFHKNQGGVTGFNLMGIRYRHEVCEHWLSTKTPIAEVLQNLKLANFDPEFYKEYETDVIELYYQKTGIQLRSKTTRSLDKVLQFLQLNR